MQGMICDSCELPIQDMSNRVQILIYTTEPVADPQIDLCLDCAANLKKDAKLKKGVQNARARRDADLERRQVRSVTNVSEDESSHA